MTRRVCLPSAERTRFLRAQKCNNPGNMLKFIEKRDIMEQVNLPERGEQLEETWTSKLDEIGYEILNSLTQTFERDYISKEHGEFTWETLLDNSEDYLSDNLDIHLTGVFRQLFFEYARIDYKYIRTHSDKELEEFPAYQEGSIPYEFIDMVNSQGYVRLFIERLANPFLLDDYFLEEIKHLSKNGLGIIQL